MSSPVASLTTPSTSRTSINGFDMNTVINIALGILLFYIVASSLMSLLSSSMPTPAAGLGRRAGAGAPCCGRIKMINGKRYYYCPLRKKWARL